MKREKTKQSSKNTQHSEYTVTPRSLVPYLHETRETENREHNNYKKNSIQFGSFIKRQFTTHRSLYKDNTTKSYSQIV